MNNIKKAWLRSLFVLTIIISTITINDTVKAAYMPYSDTTSTETTVSGDLVLSQTTIIFDKKYPYDNYCVYNNAYDTALVSAQSANPKIATAEISYECVLVTPKKTGSTTVTVTDSIGRSAVVNVTVKKNWEKENLKFSTYTGLSYGSKKMYIYSKPGAKVTVKIGGKSFSTKIGKKGYKYLNVKSIYKYKQSYKVTVKYKKSKITKKGKIYSAASAYMQTIWSCKKTIPITAYNITKGDTIYLTVGGKTYKKTFKSNKKRVEYIFTTKYENRNYHTVRIRIKNKFKQKIYDNTRSIVWR